jgi:PAS domain-containing protein
MLEKEVGVSAGTQLEYEVLRRQMEIRWVIFETLPIRVVVADLDGRLLVNPAAQKMLGPHTGLPTAPEKTIVFGWYLSGQMTPVTAEHFPLFRASQGARFSDQLFFVRNPNQPDGFWISVSGGPLKDCAEHGSGRVIFLQDFTERRQEV